MLIKADDGPSDNHCASCHGAGPDMESGKPSNPCTQATEHPSPVVCLIQATRLPYRHVKFVCARLLEPYTGGMSMFEAEGGTIA